MSRKQRLRQLGAVLFAFGLVVSMMTAGVAPELVGSAMADHGYYSGECPIDSTVYAFSFGFFGEDCAHEDSTDTSNIDDNQTALDIYSAALSADQSWEEFNTVMSNYLMDSRTVAFAKAQAAAVEAMDAGDSQSQVIAEAKAAVADYYTQREINYLQAWETKAVTVAELEQRAVNESGVTSPFTIYRSNDVTYPLRETTEPVTLNLINGTSLNFETMFRESSNTVLPYDGDPFYWLEVASQDSDHPSFRMLNTSKSSDYLTGLSSASTQIESNAEKMVNGTYDRFQNGTLNATEFLNPLTLAQEYAQQYNETGYYAYAAAVLASFGYEVPDLNETASMTIAYNGSEYTGLLMSQNAPSGGTWESGQTYDSDLIPGVQLFASSENGTFELDGTFQIMSMQNVNGTEIQNTTTQKYVYHNVTNTEYIERQENVTHLRIVMESREPGGTGGGGGLGGATGTGLAVAFLLGGAGVWYLNRE